MKTNDAVTKMCNVAPYMYDLVTDIRADENLIKDLKENQNNKAYIVFKFIPKLLQKNPNALYSILGEFSDKTAEEVAKQGIMVTINEIKELLQDEDIKGFFTSFGKTTMEE